MKEYIEERAIEIANFIIEYNATVRETAKKFGISKSTVHKDLTERLPKVDQGLARQTAEILAYHKAIRHLRGGEATRQKWLYKKQREQKESKAQYRSSQDLEI